MAIREIKDNPATLSPERKNIAPKKVYQSNLFMSAAYAGFWAKRYSDPSLLPGAPKPVAKAIYDPQSPPRTVNLTWMLRGTGRAWQETRS
jgi:hypothetical protein